MGIFRKNKKGVEIEFEISARCTQVKTTRRERRYIKNGYTETSDGTWWPSGTVFVSGRNGKTYHATDHCNGNMVSNPIAMTVKKAEMKGYRRCKRCNWNPYE